MAYCIDCGVKIIDSSINCPLCGREIEYPEKMKQLHPLFPEDTGRIVFLKVKKTNPLLMSLLTLLTLILMTIPLGIDIITDNRITWSLYPLSTLFYLYFIGTTITLFKGRGFLIYFTINLITALFLFCLDVISTNGDWFLEYALSGFIFLQGISFLTLLIVRNMESKLLKSGIIILDISIYLIILDYSIIGNLSWSVITGSILIPTTLFLITIKFLLKDF